VTKNGASGIHLGDAIHNRIYLQPEVQKRLQEAGAPYWEKSDLYLFVPGGGATQEEVDIQSFIFLRYYYDSILRRQQYDYWWEGERLRYRTHDRAPSILYGLQSINGYGRLAYLYEAGNFGSGKLVYYDAATQELVSCGGVYCSSRVTGAEYPIYGASLAHFILTMRNDERFAAILPEDAPLTLSDRVLEDFELGQGLYGLR